jgi:hypothetical protein
VIQEERIDREIKEGWAESIIMQLAASKAGLEDQLNCVCACVCVSVCVLACFCIWVCVSVSVCICIWMFCVFTSVNVSVCVYICVKMSAFVCACPATGLWDANSPCLVHRGAAICSWSNGKGEFGMMSNPWPRHISIHKHRNNVPF